MEYVILRNNGPQACDWVSVLQETVTGTEVVSVEKVGAAKHLHSCFADSHVCVYSSNLK